MKKSLKYSIPFIIFFSVIGILWRGLYLHPTEVPSPLIGKPVPVFELPQLSTGSPITPQDFKGQITLLNVWASWCLACMHEHAILLEQAQAADIQLIGYDYKDDADNAKAFLRQYGNPYNIVAFDASGKTAIDFGVYGTPESFIIDQHGLIRYKHIGAISLDDWHGTLLPLIQRLKDGAA